MSASRRSQKFNRGRWNVQRERAHLPARARPNPAFSAQPIGDLVPGFMKRLGLESSFWEQALMDQWGEIVGPQVAKVARPGKIQHKVLYIYVVNSVWLSELSRFGQGKILSNLKKTFGDGKITAVRFQIDPDQAERNRIPKSGSK